MIRLAKTEDLPVIMKIYETARTYMKENGNPAQWGDEYPAKEMLENDIRREELYVYCEDQVIHGVFAFIIGEDPTYLNIEDGSWLNDQPYGTIHRIAGDGIVKGVFKKCIDYCKKQIDNLRIDTHHDNHTMQHLISKNDFQKCGIIYVEDGSPRLAYQFVSNNNH